MDRIARFDVPTLDDLENLDCTDEVRELIIAALSDDESSHETKLEACDVLLETSGVESLNIEDAPSYTDEGIRFCPPFSYCNAGDTYNVTLIRDHKARQWMVASWGDAFEEYSQDEEIGDYERFAETPDRCPECNHTEFDLKRFGQGDKVSWSWICTSCNHHCLAEDDYTPPTIECAACTKVVNEHDSYGDGDMGDDDVPSYCSEACRDNAPGDVEDTDDIEEEHPS